MSDGNNNDSKADSEVVAADSEVVAAASQEPQDVAAASKEPQDVALANEENAAIIDNSPAIMVNDDRKQSIEEIKQNYDGIVNKSAITQEIPQNLEIKPIGTKNKIVIGSFEASTFHYSYKNRKDPLNITMFPTFGYLAVPHIGVYGQSFDPTSLRALIELSVNDSLLNVLPNSVSSAISNIMNQLFAKIDKENVDSSSKSTIASASVSNDNSSKVDSAAKHPKRAKPLLADMMDVYIVVHAKPPTMVCQHFKCDSMTEVSMMYHPWLYSDITELDNAQQITRSLLMGVFEGENVYAVHNLDVKSMLDRGMPFGCLEERNCQLHGFAFSPCNAHIGRDTYAGHCAFYSYAVTTDFERSVLSYHVFVNDMEMDQLLKVYIREAKTVEDLVNMFEMLALGKVYQNLKLLCGFKM